MRSRSRFQQTSSVPASAGGASARSAMSSAASLFMVSPLESKVHQKLDFHLVSGGGAVAAHHRESIALAAQAAGALGDAVGGVAADDPARRAGGLADGGDVEAVVVTRGIRLVAHGLLQ